MSAHPRDDGVLLGVRALRRGPNTKSHGATAIALRATPDRRRSRQGSALGETHTYGLLIGAAGRPWGPVERRTSKQRVRISCRVSRHATGEEIDMSSPALSRHRTS